MNISVVLATLQIRTKLAWISSCVWLFARLPGYDKVKFLDVRLLGKRWAHVGWWQLVPKYLRTDAVSAHAAALDGVCQHSLARRACCRVFLNRHQSFKWGIHMPALHILHFSNYDWFGTSVQSFEGHFNLSLKTSLLPFLPTLLSEFYVPKFSS